MLKLKGKEYNDLKKELKNIKVGFGIMPAELKQDQVDFEKVKKDGKTGKYTIKKLTFTTKSATPVKVKLKYNNKTEKTDYITKDNADGSVTVTGENNFYGSVVYTAK